MEFIDIQLHEFKVTVLIFCFENQVLNRCNKNFTETIRSRTKAQSVRIEKLKKILLMLTAQLMVDHR